MSKHFSAATLGEHKTSPKSSARGVLKAWIVMVAVVVIMAVSFVLMSSLQEVWQDIKHTMINVVSKAVGTEMQKDQYGNVNVLVLGYGWGGHDGDYLTDSMMVVSRHPEIGNVSMFSIPRDLWVRNPNTQGYGRINAIFAQFMRRNQSDAHISAAGTKAEVEMILGMEIPYYATIDFEAFETVIDMIGGIDIMVPETIRDTMYPNEANRWYITFHIDAGLQHLDGDTALKYARSRHSTSDFARSLRQQAIIEGIKDKILETGLDIKMAPALYDQYKTHVTTNVSLQEMLWSVQYVKTLDNFSSFGFTTNCSFQNYQRMPAACFLYHPVRDQFGGASVILPMGATANRPQNYATIQNFTQFILSHPEFVHQKARIEIINGIDKALARSKGMSTVPFAGQLAVKLKRYGFDVIKTENADSPLDASYIVVNALGEYSATLEAIQTFIPIMDVRYIPGNVITELDETGHEFSYLEGADISIYLGADYLLGTEDFLGLVQEKFSFDL